MVPLEEIDRRVRKGRVLRPHDDGDAASATATTPQPSPPSFPPGASPARRPPVLPAYQPPVSRPAETSAGVGHLEGRHVRRLRRGRRAIDARLDLHGMRQDEARAALVRFIGRCRAQGHRYVLVITGKGSPRSDRAPEPWVHDEPGVLRRNVPRWLASPDVSPMVVSYSEAGPHHGGSGALYVQVRVAQHD
jgi:DNA-nicking Smr family endonuclease